MTLTMTLRPLLLIATATGACSRTPDELPTRTPQVPSAAAQPPRAALPTPVASASVTSAAPNQPLAAACPVDPEPSSFRPERFDSTFVGGPKVALEFVFRHEDSEHGLMYRTEMDPDHGMLFKLTHKVQTFWMHNTCLSLDMLFLDEHGVVVGVLPDVPRMNDSPRSLGIPSTYVLEMNAGWSKRHNIGNGSKLVLPSRVVQAKVGG